MNNIDPSGHVFFGAQFNSSQSEGNGADFGYPDYAEAGMRMGDVEKYASFKDISRAADADSEAQQQQQNNAHESAHAGGAVQQPQQSEPYPWGDLFGNMKDLLNNPTCGNYVRDLINAAAGDNGITDISTIFNQAKYIFGRPPGDYGNGTIRGTLKGEDARVYIAPQYNISRTPNTFERVERILYGYAVTGIGETIHLANKNGVNSEEALFKAAASLPGAPPPPIVDPKDRVAVYKWGGYWHGLLKEHCLPGIRK